jgi:hypothetical protein
VIVDAVDIVQVVERFQGLRRQIQRHLLERLHLVQEEAIRQSDQGGDATL